MTDSSAPDPSAYCYERFDSAADFHSAFDRLLDLPGQELRIFDPDLADLRLNSPARIDRLERFLLGSRTRRIFLAVHDTDPLVRQCPRMLNLLRRFSHAVQVHQTMEEIRKLQDSFMVIDAIHYLRRPLARLHRGALGLNDETEALAMRARFMEIWAASLPAAPPTTLGL